MGIRIRLFWLGLLFAGLNTANGQAVQDQIIDAYFTTLTRQHQINEEISAALQQIAPSLQQEYQHLLDLTDTDGLVPWAQFRRKLERADASEYLVTLTQEGKQLHKLVQRYHDLRLVDPFSQSIIDTAQAIQRLLFFDLPPKAKIAEIGFGYGYNLHLLTLAHEDATIFANELNIAQLRLMEQKIKADYPKDRREQFRFVAGAPHATNLEGMELDLIILENVFHHLTDPTTFLRSMLRSIGDDGRIVIIEEFQDSGRVAPSCPDLMLQTELVQFFRKTGLELLREGSLENQYKTMLYFGRNTAKEVDK